MENKKQNKRFLTKILLVIYVIILTWIIVFKMQFNMKYLPYIRSINLVPFAESVIVNGKIYLKEIFYNLIVFIPVGIYIAILWEDKKIYKKILPILLLTLTYESLQYILHIGASDITDILMNTLGGILGIAIINFLYKIFKNNDKVNKVLNILATICTLLLLILLITLIIVNL